MSADDLKTLIAAWGALTGTIGSTLAVLNVVRDRSRIRVSVSQLSAKEAAKISDDLAQVRTERFVFAEIVNTGRRVRYIYRAELWVATDHLLIAEETARIFANGVWSQPKESWETWRLEEGQSVTFVFGFAEKHVPVRIDLPDSLARTRKSISGPFPALFGGTTVAGKAVRCGSRCARSCSSANVPGITRKAKPCPAV